MKGRQDSALLVLDRSPVWLVEKARKARGFVCKQILIHLNMCLMLPSLGKRHHGGPSEQQKAQKVHKHQ